VDGSYEVMNLCVPKNVQKFLSSCLTGIFYGRAKFHGICGGGMLWEKDSYVLFMQFLPSATFLEHSYRIN
jgi:hypothetical protein